MLWVRHADVSGPGRMGINMVGSFDAAENPSFGLNPFDKFLTVHIVYHTHRI